MCAGSSTREHDEWETNYTNVIKYMRRDFNFFFLLVFILHALEESLCLHTQNGWRERMNSRSCVRYDMQQLKSMYVEMIETTTFDERIREREREMGSKT